MKNIILTILLFVATITVAQNSLFKNISTTDQYTEYYSVRDKDGDGIYEIKERRFIVKFKTDYLATGEGYKIEAIVDEGKSKGFLVKSLDATQKGVDCIGYPYESLLSDSDISYVAIDDYVFLLYGLKDDGVTFKSITKVFIKKDAKAPVETKKTKKKKKFSFKKTFKKLQKMRSGGIGGNYGDAHKALQKLNLNEMITDYLVAMKAKQDGRTSAEKQQVAKNFKKGKAKVVQAKKDEWAEAKRYNDSVKATPEWKDLQRRKAQNERNYQGAKKKNKVTLRNNSSRDIYVGTSGSRNPGTKIRAGGTALWDCSRDAYLQTITKSGGSNAYSSTSQKVYRANAGCGKTINVR